MGTGRYRLDKWLFVWALCAATVAIGARPATPPPYEPTAKSSPAGGKAQQRAVLILAAEDFTRPYVRLLFEAFSDALHETPATPAIYFESIDATRFEHRKYLDDVRKWLEDKYRGTPIDLVVPIGEDALEFLADTHGEPWPEAQIFFLEAGSTRVDTRSTLPQAGGVLLENHVRSALATIKTVLPQTRHVAVVYGASAMELARWRGLVELVKQAGLETIELVGASLDGTLEAVARLPEHTVVLILAPSVDANGHVLAPTHTCELISAVGTAPAFTLGAQDLGCGVVGGLMRDWTIVGRWLGLEAMARLKTPSTAIVTLPVAEYTTLAFDDRQLERWNIPEARLPAGATIRFRQPNLWRDYRTLVLVALGVTLVQSVLIAGLVFEHRRRRRAEIESRRHLAAMAHLDRRAAMGELATSLAHEINQPLNAILQNAGVAEMLLSSNSVPPALGEITDIISDIRKDDLRASEVIRRMRSLLQKHELEASPVEINDVAQETIAIVQPDARSREVELECELTPGVPRILGDRVHLQQVLLNLLMNAIDAVAGMPADRRRVRLLTSAFDGQVRLEVSDTGAGIPSDRLSKIFEPFYTTKTGGHGMGMGLAIAHSIVEAHGGRMAAENRDRGGATVWFTVPTAGAG